MANIIKPKRTNTAGNTPTTSNLTSGELGVNMADQKTYINNGTAVVQIGAGNLVGLGDVNITSPTNSQALIYDSATSKWVNGAGGGGGAGTVTSVSGTGTVSGLTLTGTVTTSGSLTLGGTLSVANSSTTATNVNAPSTIVLRDPSGNFIAGTITANLTGNATGLSSTLATTSGGTGLTSFTSGGVVYASSTSALATGSVLNFNGTNLTNTAGFISAATDLRLGGYSYSRVAVADGGGSFLGGYNITYSGVSGAVYDSTGFISGIYYSTGGNIRFYAGGNAAGGTVAPEQMRLTTTGLGIGTSSPSAKLDVSTTTAFTFAAAASAGAMIGARGTTGGSFLVQTDSANSSYASGLAIDGAYGASASTISNVNIKAFGVYSGGGYGSTLGFWTSSNTTLAERVRIDQLGNLGIGSTTPTGIGGSYRNLVVVGSAGGCLDLSDSTGTTRATISTDNSGGNALFIDTRTSSPIVFRTTSGTSERMRITSAGDVGIGTSSIAAGFKLDVNGSIHMSTAGASKLAWGYSGQYFNWIECDGVAGNNFMRFATGNTEAMRITSALNVGIGTSTVNFKLQVKVATNGNFGVTTPNSGTGARLWAVNDAVNTVQRLELQGNPVVFPLTTGANGMYFDAVAGNLGLGVTPHAWSGGYKTIDNQIYNSMYSNNGGFAGMACNAYNDGTNWVYKITTSANRFESTLDSFRWFTAPTGTSGTAISFTQAMTFTSAGNLLLGRSSSPADGLARIAVYNTTDTAIQLTKGGVVSARVSAVSTALAFGVDGSDGATERMRISSSGDVVIGGTSTNGKFQVFDANASIRATSSAGPSIRLYAGLVAILETTTNDDLIVRTNTTERMRITSTGNVGIGTTNPTSKLYVTPSLGTTAGAKGVQIIGNADAGNAGGMQYGLYVLGLGARYSDQTGIYAQAGEGTAGSIGTYSSNYYGVQGVTGISTQAGQQGSGVFGTGNCDNWNYNGILAGVRGLATAGSLVFSNSYGLDGFHGGFGGHFVSHGKAESIGVYADAYLDASAGAGVAARPILVGTNGATIMYVMTNGGIANYSSNNTNLSDIREKKNIKDAESYLEKICAIPIKTFHFVNEGDDADRTLGVIAQDVQAIAPEFVTEDKWATPDEPNRVRLSVYQTDMQFALMKCIQEQQQIINSLKARLDAANL